MSQQTLVATKYPLDAHFPIDFSGADPNGHPAIYFVKKEDAGSSKYRTHLFIRNESDKRVVLAPKAKSAESYHFQLRFRPGMINGRMVRKMLPLFNELQSQMGLGWEWHDLTTRILSDGVIAVNFTYTGYTGEGEPDITVSYVWPPDGVINIQLRPVHDAPLSGGFFIKMELDYGLIFDDDSGIQHRHLNLAVVDLSGKTFFPIKADVVGSNTILNDGAALNQRKIHLWNTLAHSSVPIRSHGRDHESGTMITLAMRCHSGQDNNGMDRHPTVMGTRSQVAGTNLRILGIEARSNRIVEWNEPKRHEDIPGWVSWEINAPLTNSTYFINYDLPDQADSAILNSLEIEISNLISSAPDGVSNIYIHFHHVPGYADHTIIVPLEKTPLVLRGQNVGVGVLPKDGQEGFLAVNGNVGIGLAKNGDDSVSNPRIHLAIGDNDTGLQQQGDGELAIYTNNNERVRVDANGRVGIGTTDPQIQLSLGSSKTGFQYNSQYKELEIHTNEKERIRIKAEGDVGIGTTDPKEKLHVKGNIKSEGRITDKTGDVMPVGSIIAFGGSTAPQGWILCDGRPINEDIYSDLRKVLDNKSTVPNLKNRFIVGAGSKYKNRNTGGKESHILTIEEMPKHSHSITDPGHTHGFDYTSATDQDGDNADDRTQAKVFIRSGTTKSGTTGITINNSGQGKSFDIRPPYYALTYIIKY